MADLSTYSDDQLAQLAGVSLPSDQAGAPPAVHAAILGQESGNSSAAPVSTDNAHGPGQITPGTWRQYAKPWEDIDDPDDNRAVSGRIVDDLHNKFGGDPARVAVGYFSGPGNVAPPGSLTPWKKDVADGNGKSVSSYVSDVAKRLGLISDANAAEPQQEQAPAASAPASAAPAQPDTAVPAVSTMTDDELAKLAGVEIDPRMPKSGEGFWHYQAREFARPVEEMGQSIASGAKDIKDIFDPKSYTGENWPHEASDKLQGDVIQGNWLGVPLDVIKRLNETLAANPATKAVYAPAKILGAPLAPVMNDVATGLEKMGIPKDVTQFAGNISPLLLRGAKPGEKLPEPPPGTPQAPPPGAGAIPPDEPPGGAGAAPILEKPPAAPVPPEGATGAPGEPPPPPGGAGGTAEAAPAKLTPEQEFNERYGSPPASMMKTDNGAPLLVNNRSVSKGVGELNEFLSKDGIDLNDVAARLEKAQKIDPNATALDVMASGSGDIPTGANALGLAKSIAQSPGQGRAMATDLVQRGYQARQDIKGQIDGMLAGSSYYKKLNDARQAQMDSGQEFQKAYEIPNPQSPRLQGFLNEPEIKSGLKEGLTLERLDARTNGKDFKPEDYSVTGADPEGNPVISPNPNMRMLAAAKRGLDSMIEKEQDPMTGKFTPKGRALIGFKNAYQGELYRLNPQYRTANDLFSTPSSMETHMRMGEHIDTMEPQEVRNIMENPKVSAADKKAFATGAGNKMLYKLGQAPSGQNPINSLMTDNFKERMQAMAPNKAAYDKFLASMEFHKVKARVNTIVTGSPTFANEAFSNKPVTTMTGNAIRLASDPLAATGNMLGSIADKALQKNLMKMSEDSRTVAMRILTTKDPQVLRYAARKGAK